MAALFHSFGDSILKTSVGDGTLSVCEIFDDFNGNNFSIITDVAVHATETIQFSQSFDDYIHYYHFGKGVGSITFNLLLFTECGSADSPGLGSLLSKLGENRGQDITISLADVTFTGVLLDFTVQIVAEPETHFAVSVNLGMTDHTLQSSKGDSGSC